jgi:DNA-binding PadR family transcriptional regulator
MAAQTEGRDIALTSAMYHILLSLLKEERHGYAIMQAIETLSDGAMRLGPGTLYTSIRKLLEAGMIEESGERPEADDERRRYYRLTSGGREAVRVETRRLAQLVRFANRHHAHAVAL